MGREAVAIAHWRGEVAEVKVLLESSEIILRGAIKARIARADVSDVAVSAGRLQLRADGEVLVLQLGESEAVKWRGVLLQPPPTLASKLGIGPEKAAYVIGETEDVELVAALNGARSTSAAAAKVLLAILQREADLEAAIAIARKHATLFVWCVYAKGKNASPPDAVVRNFMRRNGYMDNRSCAVSATLTATRFGLRRDPAP